MSINKDKLYKRLALTTFFKVSNKVLDPEPIDKPIFINYDNWNDLKEQFFEQRMKSYDSSLSLVEKIKLETDYLNKLVSINENKTILNPKKNEQIKILVDRYKKLLSEPKKESKIKPKFEDFFKNITPKQLEKIKKIIEPLKGKNLAIFISLGINEFNFLKFDTHSKDGFSQKGFIQIQNKNYGSVNKYLTQGNHFTGYNDDLIKLKTQLETILK